MAEPRVRLHNHGAAKMCALPKGWRGGGRERGAAHRAAPRLLLMELLARVEAGLFFVCLIASDGGVRPLPAACVHTLSDSRRRRACNAARQARRVFMLVLRLCHPFPVTPFFFLYCLSSPTPSHHRPTPSPRPWRHLCWRSKHCGGCTELRRLSSSVLFSSLRESALSLCDTRGFAWHTERSYSLEHVLPHSDAFVCAAPEHAATTVVSCRPCRAHGRLELSGGTARSVPRRRPGRSASCS